MHHEQIHHIDSETEMPNFVFCTTYAESALEVDVSATMFARLFFACLAAKFKAIH